MACIEITDDDFDDMHHALGRPADPMERSFRNFFCLSSSDPRIERWVASGCWKHIRTGNEGRDAFYAVTEDGRSALADWLKLRRP